MPRVTQSIVSIVSPLAEKQGVKLHSSGEAKLRAIGREMDSKKLSLDDAMKAIDRACGGFLTRHDHDAITKALRRVM